MTSAELRQRFLDFFKANGHTIRESDSLIPSGDPTVLFTSAGMNQFKDSFLGRRTDLTRAVSCQKCLRTGDLEQVGKSASHHSFFEMLGNFSFGDYFKREAIGWGWEFLTGTTDDAGTASRHPTLCVGLDSKKLWVSIYEEDREAFDLWRALGLPAERIKRFGQAENFWPANAPKEGPNGPCGPCSEIYYDADGQVAGPKSVEVWNLVFTQYNRQSDGTLTPLARPCIDTGMGLERLARVVQGVETDYETDLFAPIMAAVRALPRGKKAKAGQAGFAERALADHARAVVFLVLDGVHPSNEGRGYVLRMLIRRAHRLGRARLDVQSEREGFVHALYDAVEAGMAGSPYAKDLAAKQAAVVKIIREEEQQFIQTLESGTARLDEIIAGLPKGRKTLSGDDAFKLYDTYGFPLELTVDIAEERGLSVDRMGFEASLKAQQQRSRAGSQFSGEVFATDALRVRERVKGLPGKEEHFVGYERTEAEAVIQGLWDGSHWVDEAREGQRVGIVLDHSPFYGEAGGQIGDTGTIGSSKGQAEVAQTTWADDVLVHHAVITTGRLKVQETVQARVDAQRRLRIARSHTATHLLHWALHRVLGPEAVQAGAYNEAERLRFDFSSRQGLQAEERAKVEALVAACVRQSDAVRAQQMDLQAAKQAGALALFGEKYGSRVRVVDIGGYSKELCGGTHLPHTGLVGSFTIVAESSIAAGTRRIEAIVGEAATAQQLQHTRTLHQLAQELGRGVPDLVPGIEELLERVKRYEKELKSKQVELARAEAPRLVAEAVPIGSVRFVKAALKHADPESLAVLADAIRERLGDGGIVLLASSYDGRAAVVMTVTAQLSKTIHAGQIMKEVAKVIEGSGGGRPEFAQGGGKNPAAIPAVLKRAEELVREALESSRR
ncbi:MAG: alanine--tRNA ligase [Candidatus Omnitrophica bacterium]|nr:alanine--tRNA ligase [Candidatus Omnitrophota bacterium]